MTDIRNKADIKVFVDTFYSQIQADELVGAVFAGKIKEEEWPQHLEKMYAFWNSILFQSAEYHGNPFSHHINLNIGTAHFERWITLFQKSIDANFEGGKAEEAKLRTGKMRILFESKLAHIKSNDKQFPIM